MKILTIAGPRVGGKYFTKYLADEYGLIHHHEPVIDYRLDKILSKDNISVKLITTHLYKHYHLDIGLEIDDSVNKIYEYLNKFNFDIIFLLDRHNTDEYVDAIINLHLNPHNNHVEWVYDESFKNQNINEDSVLYWKDYIEESSRWLKLLSNKFELPIIYYDDLYYNTKSVDLQGLQFKPDLSKRLRKEIKPNTII